MWIKFKYNLNFLAEFRISAGKQQNLFKLIDAGCTTYCLIKVVRTMLRGIGNVFIRNTAKSYSGSRKQSTTTFVKRAQLFKNCCKVKFLTGIHTTLGNFRGNPRRRSTIPSPCTVHWTTTNSSNSSLSSRHASEAGVFLLFHNHLDKVITRNLIKGYISMNPHGKVITLKHDHESLIRNEPDEGDCTGHTN